MVKFGPSLIRWQPSANSATPYEEGFTEIPGAAYLIVFFEAINIVLLITLITGQLLPKVRTLLFGQRRAVDRPPCW